MGGHEAQEGRPRGLCEAVVKMGGGAGGDELPGGPGTWLHTPSVWDQLGTFRGPVVCEQKPGHGP